MANAFPSKFDPGYYYYGSHLEDQRAHAKQRCERLKQEVRELERYFGFEDQTGEDGVFTHPQYKQKMIAAMQRIAETDENQKINMPMWRKIMEVLMYPEVTVFGPRPQKYSQSAFKHFLADEYPILSYQEVKFTSNIPMSAFAVKDPEVKPDTKPEGE